MGTSLSQCSALPRPRLCEMSPSLARSYFHYLFLVGGEADDLTNDLSDDSNSLAVGALSAGSLCLLGAHHRLSQDEALVQANEDSLSSLIF